jgi:hypothetical protein
MSAVAFDTLKLAQDLRDKANFSPTQAEGMAHALSEAITDQLASRADLTLLATKDDLAALGKLMKGDLAALEKSMKGDLATLEKSLKGDLSMLEKSMKGDLSTLEKSMKGDLATLEKSMKGDLATLENSTRVDLTALGNWMKDDLVALEKSTKDDFAALGKSTKDEVTGLARELAAFRIETKGDLARLETKIESSKSETLRWMVGAIGFQTLAVMGTVFGLVRFFVH